MAIANKFPNIRPSLLLDFANSKTIDPRITFTRASSVTYFDEKGVMRTAMAGVPCIDFDPVTGECKGLLIEEQRTNLLTYSEQFDNAAWTKTRSSITANSTTAPDGTLTADKLIEDTTASLSHNVQQGVTAAANTTVTASCFVKASERQYVILRISPDGSNVVTCGFNLSSGTVGTAANSGNGSGAVGSITPVGNGWFRCVLSGIPSSTVANPILTIYTSLGGSYANADMLYTGDGTSGIYIWGAQLEASATPSSYIKTEASQVTRAADVASMTGTNFSDWANSVGTILAKYKTAGWKHNNTPPATQLDLTKYIHDGNQIASDHIERLMFYPRQLTESQIAALKG